MNKFAVGFCLVLLAGCYSRHPIPDASSTQLATQAAPPASVTRIPPTKTPAPTVTLPPTFTLTPSPTWTPLPTLVNESDFLDFVSFTGISACKLPCWAGITPNQTTWEEVVYFFTPLESVASMGMGEVDGAYGKENAIVASLHGYPGFIKSRVAAIPTNENKVYSIKVEMQAFTTPTENSPSRSLPLPETLRMKSVLREYGMPDMVFLSTDIGGPGFPKTHLATLMVYTDKHFLIIYHREAIAENGVLTSCTPSDSFTLVIVNEGGKLASSDTISNNPETNVFNFDPRYSFDKVMDIPLDEFYQKYLSSSSNCFYIPLEAWGYGKSWE